MFLRGVAMLHVAYAYDVVLLDPPWSLLLVAFQDDIFVAVNNSQ